MTYEFADYGSIDNRIKEDGYYDAYDDVYYDASSSSDEAMNHNTKETLKGVSTLKLGVEYKPISSVAFRIGYNYVSPIFETNGFRDGTVLSPGTMFASSTDYTNWKSTNRFTFGVGYNYKKLTFDLAYQYSQQKGDFYPFMSYNDGTTKNVPDATAVENNRHQMLFTVGYKF